MRLNHVLAAAVLIGLPAAASATTITFTGLPSGVQTATFQEAGFNLGFNGFFTANGTVEPLCCQSGGSLTITKIGGGTFTFTGLDGVRGYFESGPSASLTANGFLGGSPVFSQNFVFSTINFVTVASNYSGAIDELVFTGQRDFSAGVTFDNVTLGSGAVPEPASWALMIAGFGLVGAAMRRRQTIASAVA